ncbi:hydrophobe/amphiphile efflux-1 (HAE1) family protein [Nitrobacteraceae bacterium AZCC 1564]
MNLGRFFIDRPVFAIAMSIAMLIIGVVAASRLPVSQYPEVVPPTVTVLAQYPGASAQTIADTVATPIEQEVNGVDDMIYLQSQSTQDGRLNLTITFKIGTDLDKAQVLVQNRVALAEPRLPDVVRRVGVTVRKNSPDFLVVVQLISPDHSCDGLYMSNYAAQQIVPVLERLPGVGDAQIIAEREYAMRIWLDPDKVSEMGLSAADVVAALQSQNVQVAGGNLGRPPISERRAFQEPISVQGRFLDPREFEQIIVKRDDGRIVRLRDIGRAELGARDYGTNAYINDSSAVAILIFQRPGTNALQTSEDVQNVMKGFENKLPLGVNYLMTYNPTEFFVRTSIDALQHTIYEAIALVVLVVVVFLQSLRTTIIPLLAIPVSLVGTFAAMAALGYSINTLTLFALVLAVGIVVDDAIVVVENVERYLHEGMSPKDAARKTMDEVGGALISIALVLVAVFVPTMFLDGITGQFFRQFAVVIAVATVISAFNSLTLSPALAGLLLKPYDGHSTAKANALSRMVRPFVDGFNRFFDVMSEAYGKLARRVVGGTAGMLLVYAVLVGTALWPFSIVPRGFVPAADQGYLIATAELPPGASLQRTDAVVQEMGKRARQVPGVEWSHIFAGQNFSTGTLSSNTGVVYAQLEAFDKRHDESKSVANIQAELQKRFADITDAKINILTPPTMRGIGASGGFSLRIQDINNRGSAQLDGVTQKLLTALRADPRIAFAFSPFSATSPGYFLDIDRTKAEMLGVPTQRVHETLETYLGSAYVNDFNLSGRTYQVIVQADGVNRLDVEQIAKLKARSDSGDMVPLGSIATFRTITAPDRVPRYNLYPSSEVIGNSIPSMSSGETLALVEQIAAKTLPDGYATEWTELSYQERLAAGGGALFALSVVFVFLVLAAQYESWFLPLSVILIVPMCLLSAIAGVMWMGQDNNILTQIGLVVLVGLAAKNAILIVEFARDLELEGESIVDAVVHACRLRLRPILMTSLAFILGVVPLMLAKGAGAELRHAIGTTVFFGMLGVTAFGLIFTPVFYVVIRRCAELLRRRKARGMSMAADPLR